MKQKVSLVLFTALICASCGKSGSSNQDANYNHVLVTTTNSLTGENPSSTLPALAYSFGAEIELFNYTDPRLEKMKAAVEILKLVVATEEFRTRVINFTYNGKRAFVDNDGKTNEQIYQMILDGAEILRPQKNNMLDAQVQLYFDATSIIGYTYPNSVRIWVNTKYFDTYTAAGVAHNLFHEWMHKLGFVHSVSWNASRDSSVPYAIGYIVGEIGQKFL